MYRMRPLIMNAGHPEKRHSVTCPWIFSIPDEYLYIVKAAAKIDKEKIMGEVLEFACGFSRAASAPPIPVLNPSLTCSELRIYASSQWLDGRIEANRCTEAGATEKQIPMDFIAYRKRRNSFSRASRCLFIEEEHT